MQCAVYRFRSPRLKLSRICVLSFRRHFRNPEDVTRPYQLKPFFCQRQFAALQYISGRRRTAATGNFVTTLSDAIGQILIYQCCRKRPAYRPALLPGRIGWNLAFIRRIIHACSASLSRIT